MKKIGLVLLVALTILSCNNTPAVDTSDNKPVVLRLLKTDESQTTHELKKINLGVLETTDLNGKVAVVDFWATWCHPCIAEIPKYNALKEKYAGQDVEIVGVTVESGSMEDIIPKIEEFQMKYQVVYGDDRVVEAFGGVIGFPTTFIVSKNGTIHKRYLGPPENKIELLEKDIETLLGH